MARQFQFDILTRDKTFFSARVTSLVCPEMIGFFGVLAHHAPLVARSRGGRLTIRQNLNEERAFRVGPGILEVLPARLSGGTGGRVILLTKQAEAE